MARWPSGAAIRPCRWRPAPEALRLGLAELFVQLPDLQLAVAGLAADLQELRHVAPAAFRADELLEQVALVLQAVRQRLGRRIDGFLGQLDRLDGERGD